MKVYGGLRSYDLKEVPAQAQRAEALGFDGVSFGELAHDVFLLCALALEHTSRLRIGTSIAIAFPRSPMIVAHTAWDLQRMSGGRFELGLGTQVKGHNERRFSVPWSPPAPRIREYIQSLRAIWDCWQNGAPLDYQGRHYTFTLMTPEFNPGPIDAPSPPVYLAAVGQAMCRAAGEAADGLLMHSFNTRRYTEEVVLPMVAQGAKRAGRPLDSLMVSAGGMIATGATEAQVHAARENSRRRIAFYGSTRTYKAVLDAHEWGDTCLRLHELSLQGKWSEMPKLVDDTMLDTFCVSGAYDQIGPRLKERFGAYAQRIGLGLPENPRHEDRLGALIEELHRG
ncbi:MAG: TIGR03617 family F420-dependent LLM class oxidoreductase [Chloroflexi bacterium]|nr:TIGR03617 family F420-dependent LLM class oxidoreductase [Chloroflexota bacterium]